MNGLRKAMQYVLCSVGLHKWSGWDVHGYGRNGVQVTQSRMCMVCRYKQKRWL